MERPIHGSEIRLPITIFNGILKSLGLTPLPEATELVASHFSLIVEQLFALALHRESRSIELRAPLCELLSSLQPLDQTETLPPLILGSLASEVNAFLNAMDKKPQSPSVFLKNLQPNHLSHRN